MHAMAIFRFVTFTVALNHSGCCPCAFQISCVDLAAHHISSSTICLALDSASGKEWMFNEIQKEHVSGVQVQAREFIEAENTDFHGALSTLMRAVGSSAEISPR